MWQQALLAKRRKLQPDITYHGPAQINELGFLTEKSEIVNKFAYQIHKESSQFGRKTKYFINRRNGSLFIGVVGRLPEILGENHEFAYEVNSYNPGPGRPITFVNIYSSDVPSPSIPNFSEFQKRQKSDIESILKIADVTGDEIQIPVTSFDNSEGSGTDWDKIAAEIKKAKWEVAFFSLDGVLIKCIESSSAAKSNLTEKKSAPQTRQNQEKRKSLSQAMALIAVGVLTVGWVTIKLLEKKTTGR